MDGEASGHHKAIPVISHGSACPCQAGAGEAPGGRLLWPGGAGRGLWHRQRPARQSCHRGCQNAKGNGSCASVLGTEVASLPGGNATQLAP